MTKIRRNIAPVALFAYNRPRKLLKALEHINLNHLAELTDLYVFIDGNKGEEDRLKVGECERIAQSFDWIGNSKTIVRRQENYGLADNIVQGVTEVVQRYSRVIVLEDDLETSVGFLKYMNDALDFYMDEKTVMHIAGYMFPIDLKSRYDTLFYQVTSCWGWATWDDRWQYYNSDAKYLLNEINKRELQSWFDLDNSGVFLSQLEANVNGTLKTWAIKWQASVNLQSGMSLHPKQSLVRNVGFDATGENCGKNEKYMLQQLAVNIELEKIPLIYNKDLKNKMKKYYKKQGLVKRLKMKFRDVYSRNRANDKPSWHKITGGPALGKRMFIAPNRFSGWKEMISGQFDYFWYNKLTIEKYKPKQILDIGCHFGYHSICLASMYNSARIVCVEPNPANVERLKVNFKGNGLTHLEIEQLAISDQNGEAEFRFSENVESSQSTGSYLLNVAPPLDHDHYVSFKNTIVQTETIDSLCERQSLKPSLIKIDIEGAEMLAIKGARKVIANYLPVLCIEAHSENLKEELTDYLSKDYHIEILESDDVRSFLFCSPL
jgi:FkbM family methyltransferase